MFTSAHRTGEVGLDFQPRPLVLAGFQHTQVLSEGPGGPRLPHLTWGLWGAGRARAEVPAPTAARGPPSPPLLAQAGPLVASQGRSRPDPVLTHQSPSLSGLVSPIPAPGRGRPPQRHLF